MTAVLSKSLNWCNLCTIHAGMGRVVLLLPKNSAELKDCISRCLDGGVRPFIVGAGTNLVGSDDDDICRAIRLPVAPCLKVDGRMARCNAGALGTRILQLLAAKGLGGASALSGIPGTLGGMLAMNAGALGAEISTHVVEIHGISLTTGEQWRWVRGDGGWGYRRSPIPRDVCATEAVLEFAECSPEQELALIGAELSRRRRVTPSWWSAGSVFRNPSPESPAGRLLEAAGCKGLRNGPFAVSERHANWIVNAERRGGAAESIRWLVNEMRRRSDVPLECEIRFVD